ncbi:MAG: hypothetical protein EPN93_05775 [Spirochaetes bacterium]|nr:MAG: hypothetical protein EPN93_05775 [Spirochaetota bacterium]
MNPKFDYMRNSSSGRRIDRIVDLGDAGVFGEIIVRNTIPPEEIYIGGLGFKSIHIIDNLLGLRVFTAYRCDLRPEILLIVWKGFPFNAQIEEGGDFMLQAMLGDPRIKHLVIDNTYVQSGWMNTGIMDYLTRGWIPGLVWCGVRTFCHLQAESYLGSSSFQQFGRMLMERSADIGCAMKKETFKYFPIHSSGNKDAEAIDERMRESAFRKAFEILESPES